MELHPRLLNGEIIEDYPEDFPECCKNYIKRTAQKVPLSITYYEGSNGGAGAVWLKRKVRVKPNLIIRLKVAINNLAKDQTDQERIIDGMAIVLSQNTNFLGGGLGGKPFLFFIFVFI